MRVTLQRAALLADDSRSSDSPYVPWRPSTADLSLLQTLRIELVTINETESPAHAQLFQSFRHNSGNGLVYERFCTVRFMTLELLMRRHGMQSAAMWDMDSSPFSNLFDAYGADTNWGFGSWAASWTLERLSRFNAFILDFYAGSERRVAENFMRWGVPIEARTEYWLLLKNRTDSWWPADLRDRHHMITDMELYRAFLAEHAYPFLTCRLTAERRECASVTASYVRQAGQPDRMAYKEALFEGATSYGVNLLNYELQKQPGNPDGCRIYRWDSAVAHAEQMRVHQEDFLAVFSLRRESTSFSPAFDAAYAGPLRVTYVHFNGYCKPIMCQRFMCENVLRWAAAQAVKPELEPLKPCCGYLDAL